MKKFYDLDTDGNILTVSPCAFMGSIELEPSPDDSLYKRDFELNKWVINEAKVLKEVHMHRKEQYDLGLQVGALMKQVNYDRLQGKELIQELDDALGHVQKVKNAYPKPEEEKEIIDDTI